MLFISFIYLDSREDCEVRLVDFRVLSFGYYVFGIFGFYVFYEKVWDRVFRENFEEIFKFVWSFLGFVFKDWEMYNVGKEGSYLNLLVGSWFFMIGSFIYFRRFFIVGGMMFFYCL